MNKPLTIETAQKTDAKEWAKFCLGAASSFVFHGRFSALLQNPKADPDRLIDKLLMSCLKRRALRRKDQMFFERLHNDFWQGKGGEVFAANCDHRFHDLFLTKQREDFAALQREWGKSKLDKIVELGCNSGLVLNHLTTNLRNVESSVGIDINQQQITKNNSLEHFDSRVRFECTDGGNWLLQNGDANTLFVTNGGVLEYFRRERLDEILKHISKQLTPSMFFSIEPVAADHDWTTMTDSVPFGEELSFSHNYTDLFESNGFKIVHQRSTEFESWKMVATIAKTS